MAFKKLTSLETDITIALGGVSKEGKKNPSQIEGYYLGSRTTKSDRSKNGVSNIYVLQTAEGNVGVWGKTHLDKQMPNVTPGAMIRITQSGKQRTKNGDMYLFEVEQDLENVIEVSSNTASPAASAGAVAQESYGYDGGDETEDEDDGGYEEEVTPVATKVASAERKAMLEARLAGKGLRK